MYNGNNKIIYFVNIMLLNTCSQMRLFPLTIKSQRKILWIRYQRFILRAYVYFIEVNGFKAFKDERE